MKSGMSVMRMSLVKKSTRVTQLTLAHWTKSRLNTLNAETKRTKVRGQGICSAKARLVETWKKPTMILSLYVRLGLPRGR